MARRLIRRGRRPTHHTWTLRTQPWVGGPSVKLAHDQEQTPDLIDTPQIFGELVSILFSSRLVFLFRHVSRHEPALKGQKVLGRVGDLVPEISNSLSEGLSELRHLIGHGSVCSAQFFSEHRESLSEAVDVRHYLVYADFAQFICP